MKQTNILSFVLLAIGFIYSPFINSLMIFGDKGYDQTINHIKAKLHTVEGSIHSGDTSIALSTISTLESDVAYLKEHARQDLPNNILLRAYLAANGLYPKDKINEINAASVVADFISEIAKLDKKINDLRTQASRTPTPPPLPPKPPIPFKHLKTEAELATIKIPDVTSKLIAVRRKIEDLLNPNYYDIVKGINILIDDFNEVAQTALDESPDPKLMEEIAALSKIADQIAEYPGLGPVKKSQMKLALDSGTIFESYTGLLELGGKEREKVAQLISNYQNKLLPLTKNETKLQEIAYKMGAEDSTTYYPRLLEDLQTLLKYAQDISAELASGPNVATVNKAKNQITQLADVYGKFYTMFVNAKSNPAESQSALILGLFDKAVEGYLKASKAGSVFDKYNQDPAPRRS